MRVSCLSFFENEKGTEDGEVVCDDEEGGFLSDW